MVKWSQQSAPMWYLICENLACLNEECGEIALSMLASMQKPFQRGVVETTDKQFKEVLLRFQTGLQWEEEFGHVQKASEHYKVKDKEV
jgi:hypothetical protein